MKSLFDPLDICSLHARNSAVRAATAESIASPAGRPTQALVDTYEKLAEGGVGTIITGYAFIAPDGKPSERALNICDNSYADDYCMLADRVHAHGARLVLQLVYGGSKSKVADDDPRRLTPAAHESTNGIPNVRIAGPSALENPKTHLVPTEATCEDLKRIAKAFGEAAVRARNWGFDGVEIHAAHGYLLSQFLSRRFNVRGDEYGGTLKNRARLTVECVREVRSTTSPDYPILVKVNSCDDYDDPNGTHGGLSEDESAQVCAWLADAGASAIDVSGDWHAFRSSDIAGNPFFARFGARLARELGIPIIVTGGWRRLDLIQKHLAADGIAAIGLSRPLICESDLINRWSSGNEEPSRCTSCNHCAKHPGIPCILHQ